MFLTEASCLSFPRNLCFSARRQSRIAFWAHAGSVFALAKKAVDGHPRPERKTISLLSQDSFVYLLRMAPKNSFSDSPLTMLLSFLALAVTGGLPPCCS